MSKLFYDHLVELKEIDKQIKKVAKTHAEQEELWGLVDEMVHHKVFGCILDKLPREHHEEFLEMVHKAPHDSEYLFTYLKSKVGNDIEVSIKNEIENFSVDLLKDIK